MELQQSFEEAQKKTSRFSTKPSQEELLELYSLYKQGSEGDVQGERPGGFDFKAIAKFDAWKSKLGISKEDAMDTYIKLVDQLFEKYG